MKTTAVIMAGGRGERFWPLSRAKHPKQFLSLTGDGRTMLQQAAGRAALIAANEYIFVVTNAMYRDLVRAQLPGIPQENILLEPCPRSTGPCIGFAASIIRRLHGDAVMAVMPSDHLIGDDARYAATMARAAALAKAGDSLVTVGIPPAYPETGYGYMLCGPEAEDRSQALPVLKFVEKPDEATATTYVQSGRYLWNSGIFIFKASSILTRIEALLPGMAQGLREIAGAWGAEHFAETLARCYERFNTVSIDRGVLERTQGILALKGDFGWDDAGSLLVFGRISPADDQGNVALGDILTAGARNCLIVGGQRHIAAVGVENLIVVDTGDALLICDQAALPGVRDVLRRLEGERRDELL